VFNKRRALGGLQASLRKVAKAVFRAENSDEISPDHYVGSSVTELKIWVDQIPSGLGCSRVFWDALPSWRGEQ
jgi:hypothetical protein